MSMETDLIIAASQDCEIMLSLTEARAKLSVLLEMSPGFKFTCEDPQCGCEEFDQIVQQYEKTVETETVYIMEMTHVYEQGQLKFEDVQIQHEDETGQEVQEDYDCPEFLAICTNCGEQQKVSWNWKDAAQERIVLG